MTSPYFTVIVPVYNASATIAETVRSVLAQSDRDFELLLIDDGSSDDSLAVIREMETLDGRIRVFSHANAGVASTRNRGIELARGAVVAFLDSDDLWYPTKLATHRAIHKANPAVGVSFAQIAFLEMDKAAHAPARTYSTVPSEPLTLAQVIGENPVCTTSNIVATRRTLAKIGGFRPGMAYAEDQEWLARAVDGGEIVQGIDLLLVDYRMSPTGLSSNLRRMYAGWRRLAITYRGQFDMPAAEALYCRYLSRRALRSGGKSTDALRFAMRGLSLNPPAFLADIRRGGFTLCGALVSPLLPRRLRTRIFA